MKITSTLLLLAAFLAPASGAESAAEAESRKLVGLFDSSYQDGKERVEAEFSPAGEARWTVAFRFRFNGARHLYEGTAEGSLDEGELKGRVTNGSGSRTFTFEGEIENGRFEGTHAELRRGRAQRTGTITLEG